MAIKYVCDKCRSEVEAEDVCVLETSKWDAEPIPPSEGGLFGHLCHNCLDLIKNFVKFEHAMVIE